MLYSRRFKAPNLPAGTRCLAMLLNAFWGALGASERVLVNVSEAFKVACSWHVFVSVHRRARGAGLSCHASSPSLLR